MNIQRRREEPAGSFGVASRGDVHIDDLAVLIDSPIYVAPSTGDLHVGFVDRPTVPNRVTARPGRVDQQRGEVLHPPEHGDVIDLDPAFNHELLDVAVRPQPPSGGRGPPTFPVRPLGGGMSYAFGGDPA